MLHRCPSPLEAGLPSQRHLGTAPLPRCTWTPQTLEISRLLHSNLPSCVVFSGDFGVVGELGYFTLEGSAQSFRIQAPGLCLCSSTGGLTPPPPCPHPQQTTRVGSPGVACQLGPEVLGITGLCAGWERGRRFPRILHFPDGLWEHRPLGLLPKDEEKVQVPGSWSAAP